uniref:Uncharacterized protein n=1 Tax=Arion vulgaris TaxID=1028688 RepID=A0A0B6XY81_9EUPU
MQCQEPEHNLQFIATLCCQHHKLTMNKAQTQKITTCEIRCLRKVTNNIRRNSHKY